jgi:hypothetical protein
MRHQIRFLALLSACFLGAACHNSTGSNGDLTATASDSIGDTFGTAGFKQWDISSMKFDRDTGGVTITLTFTTNIILPTTGDTTAMIGEVDLDVDQSAATGDTSLVDFYRPGAGFTGLGVDYVLDFFDINPDSTVPVFSLPSGTQQGVVKASVSGKTITARIPRTMLGTDDGYLNGAAIVGTVAEPTDIVPNNGHLHLGGTGADVASGRYVGPTAVPRPSAIRWHSRVRQAQ